MFAEIRNDQGERLDFTYTPAAAAPSPGLVVIGHGVTANKDRPWLVALSDALAEAGIASVRVSFSGNGASEGRFQDSAISKEVADLGAVLDAAAAHAPGLQLVYAGHSMGGAVGVLRAAADPRIRALVSIAGMVHTRDFAARKFGELTPGRDLMWDKPECPLSQTFLDDMAALDTVAALGARIHVPWLLVHGTADTVVPLKDSHDIRAAAGGRPELVELPGVDHVFSGEGTPAMTRAVVRFVAAQLEA
jgi:uncharacterized protein